MTTLSGCLVSKCGYLASWARKNTDERDLTDYLTASKVIRFILPIRVFHISSRAKMHKGVILRGVKNNTFLILYTRVVPLLSVVE
jgi:hypothetical protein